MAAAAWAAPRTTLRRARAFSGIVKRSAFRHADQHGLLRQRQRVHLLAKIVGAGKREAVNALGTVLTDVNLIQIELKDAVLAEFSLKNKRIRISRIFLL